MFINSFGQKRWYYYENPFGFKMPSPPTGTKPLVTKWEELPDDQKEIVLGIKKVIQSFAGDCQISLFGSRLKGYWTETSDYDIFVHIDNPSENIKKNILTYDYGRKVDIFFTTKIGDPVTLLIP